MVRKRVLVADIPAPVLDALAVDQPNRPINDLCAEILSRRYQLPFEPSGRQGRNWKQDASLVLKLPEPVWAALKQEATPYSSIREVVIRALAEHYAIKEKLHE
jgi:hypothetical protein